LTALTTLVTSSHPQPNYILCFPTTVEMYSPAPSRRPSGSNSPTIDSPTADNNVAGNLAWTLHQQHIRAGIELKHLLLVCILAVSGLNLNHNARWFLTVFVNLSRKVRGQYLKLRYDHCFPCSLQCIALCLAII